MAKHTYKFGDSSRVAYGTYDDVKKELELEWKNQKSPYIYSGISPQTWAAMKRAPSAGQFVSRVLNSYPYRKKGK